nr:hypothetical protein [Tanacetum cinerariifolium]
MGDPDEKLNFTAEQLKFFLETCIDERFDSSSLPKQRFTSSGLLQEKIMGENILKSINKGLFHMRKFRETLAEGALYLGPERDRVFADLTLEEKDRRPVTFFRCHLCDFDLEPSSFDFELLRSFILHHLPDLNHLDQLVLLTDILILIAFLFDLYEHKANNLPKNTILDLTLKIFEEV